MKHADTQTDAGARRIVQNAIAANTRKGADAPATGTQKAADKWRYPIFTIPHYIGYALIAATDEEKLAVLRPLIEWGRGNAYTRPAGVLGYLFDEIKQATETQNETGV